MALIDQVTSFAGTLGADVSTVTSADGNAVVPATISPGSPVPTWLLDGAGGTYVSADETHRWNLLYINATPPTADFAVTATVDFLDNNFGRMGPAIVGAANWLSFAFLSNFGLSSWQFYSPYAGNFGDVSAAIPSGTHVLKFVRSAGMLSGYVDGVLTCGPIADPALGPDVGTGFGGFYASADVTATTGAHLTALAAATFSGTIAVTIPEAFEVVQRGAGGTASVAVSGTFDVMGGTPPTAIEASIDGTNWVTLDPAPNLGAGTYSGTLANVPTGAFTLSVRYNTDHSANAAVTPVGVGDLFLLAGQSNMEGEGTNHQPYLPPDTGAFASVYSGGWAEIIDPVGGGGGSFIPWIANALVDSAFLGYPVAFIPTAVFGSPISSWAPGQANFIAATAAVAAAGGAVKTVLWLQGETDALNGVSQSTYKAAIDATAAGFLAAFGAPTMVAVLENFGVSPPTAGTAAIQAAQRQCVGAPNYTAFQPDLSDILTTPDSVHILTDPRLYHGGTRFAVAITKSAGVFGGGGILANSLDGGFL